MKRSAVSSLISKKRLSFSLVFAFFFSPFVKLVRSGTTSFDCSHALSFPLWSRSGLPKIA
jgi:hypothetical protein